jgi:hypothetical protein
MITLFPSAYQIEHTRLRQLLEEAHHAWWTQWRAQQQLHFIIENIRFEHDPEWRNRAFSIQSARDANHWIWKATRIVFLDSVSI